jgi:hypothetical protein
VRGDQTPHEVHAKLSGLQEGSVLNQVQKYKEKLTINLLDIYTAPCVMFLRRELHITRGIAIVVLKVEPVLGPGIARAYLGLLNGTRRQPRAI